MSGGSYDYLCYKMQDAAQQLMKKEQCAYRRAFGELMTRCAEAMHDVEWVDSNDKSQGDDEAAIMKCITFSNVLKASLDEADKTAAELNRLIELARKE
jgi:hypothetical protein